MEPHSNSNEKEVSSVDVHSLGNGTDILKRRIPQAPLHTTGEVGQMNTGTMSHVFLSGTTLRPHVAYLWAKRRMVVVHLTGTLPTHSLHVQ